MRRQRCRGDDGQVGGIEVIPFGILTFVIVLLVIANAWGAIDADLATTAAARDAVRTYVEAPDEWSAGVGAIVAAHEAIAGHGRSASNTQVAVSYPDGRGWSRCSRVRITVRHPMPAIRVPIIGGFGHGFDAIATSSEIIDPYRSGLPGSATC